MSQGDFRDIEIMTDVLVIGGGMAGCFAAINAKDQGLSVVLIDKGYVGQSGSTPFPARSVLFNPEWGDDLGGWMDLFVTTGEYLTNRQWTEIILKDSYARYQDLISWGWEVDKQEDGTILRGSPLVKAISYQNRKVGLILRNEAEKRGVKVIDRVMATELITQNGAVVGAVGVHLYGNRFYVFGARATVLAAGSGNLRADGFPLREMTHDADCMAYRAGAEVSGKEFNDAHTTNAVNPADMGVIRDTSNATRRPPPMLRMVNAEGNQLDERLPITLRWAYEAHAGRAPVFNVTIEGPSPIVSGTTGMSHQKGEGLWPTSMMCATSLPGLYAAGDCLATYQNGAYYHIAGSGTTGSYVTGARAGRGAAEFALRAPKVEMEASEIARLRKLTLAPAERMGGFSPEWVTQVLKGVMVPYYVLFVKQKDRMQAALTFVEFIRDHLVPALTAKDLHQLRLANETRNMVLNAEMKLRAGLFRTESRGSHYREDYPRRDDPTWLAWVVLKEERGQMKTLKRPVPEEWWPDLTKPYEARYPVRFPGE